MDIQDKKINICPICGVDGQIANSRFSSVFLGCNACGGQFAIKREVASYAENYFEEADKPSFLNRWCAPIFDILLYLRMRKIFSVYPGAKDGQLLDYGAGPGKLVSYLRKCGFKNVVGFDPSPAAVDLAEKMNIPIFNSVKGNEYDLVMFWHSLEHMEDPLRKVIEDIAPLVKKGGALLIAVPNAASWEALLARDKWFHYDYPHHLIQFTPGSVEKMLAVAGWSVDSWDFFNPEYTMSGLIQTFLNLFLPKNVLYAVVSHRRSNTGYFRAIFFVLISFLLLIIFSPLLLLFYAVQLTAGRTGAIIVVAKKYEK